MKEDILVMYDLENKLKDVIESVDWKKIRYTVPGSMEKILEVQAGITNSIAKVGKTIKLIEDGLNENQKDETYSRAEETGEEV